MESPEDDDELSRAELEELHILMPTAGQASWPAGCTWVPVPAPRLKVKVAPAAEVPDDAPTPPTTSARRVL